MLIVGEQYKAVQNSESTTRCIISSMSQINHD